MRPEPTGDTFISVDIEASGPIPAEYSFHRFLQSNPFGIAGVDVQSFDAGMTGASYSASRMKQMEGDFTEDFRITHNALADALAQAVLFERLLARRAAHCSKR